MDPGLYLGYHLLVGARQKLDEIAAGSGDRLVQPYQYTQGTGGWDLLALHKVHGQVVSDLTGKQTDRPHIGLLQSDVLDDGKGAVGSHRGPHVQLAPVLLHQVHLGVLDIAPDVALIVGHRQNGAQGAAPFDLKGEGALLLLEHVAHHRGPQQSPPQGGGGHGQQLVDVSSPLHHVPSSDSDSFDQAVAGYCSYDFVAHRYYLSFLAVKKTRCSPSTGGRIFNSPNILIWEKPACRSMAVSSSVV